jgi:hypothetical protein
MKHWRWWLGEAIAFVLILGVSFWGAIHAFVSQ